MAGKSIPSSVLLGLLLTTTCGPLAHAASAIGASTARREIEATLKQRNAAHDRKDVDGYMQTFTPSYASVDVMGHSVSYAKLRQAMVDNFARGNVSNVSWRISNVSVHGSTAKVELMTIYNYPAIKSPHPAHAYQKAVTDQIWTKGSGGWQERSEEESLREIIYSKKPVAL